MRRAWALLAVVALVVSAGCLGFGGPSEPSTTPQATTTAAPSTTDTPETTATPTPTTHSPPTTVTTTTVPSVTATVQDPPKRIQREGGKLTVAITNPADEPQEYTVRLVANRTVSDQYRQTYDFSGRLSPDGTHLATITTDWGATGEWALVLDGERVAVLEAYGTGGGGGGTPPADPSANGSVDGQATTG